MDNTTKNKIINTTLKIISTEGYQKATIRNIADKAGVNIAAVNYHFKSKEELIKEAQKLFGEKTKNIIQKITNPEMPPRERIKAIIYTFTDHLIEYPGFLKSFFQSIIAGQEPPKQAANNIIQNRKIIFQFLKTIYDEDDETIKNTIVQLMSAVLFPVIMGDKMEKYYEIKFQDSEYRKRYIDQLLEQFDI